MDFENVAPGNVTMAKNSGGSGVPLVAKMDAMSNAMAAKRCWDAAKAIASTEPASGIDFRSKLNPTMIATPRATNLVKSKAMVPNIELKLDVLLFRKREIATIQEFEITSQKELLKFRGVEMLKYNNQIRSDCKVFGLSIAALSRRVSYQRLEV